MTFVKGMIQLFIGTSVAMSTLIFSSVNSRLGVSLGIIGLFILLMNSITSRR